MSMSEKREYTAEDYEQIHRAWTCEPTDVYEDEVIISALRIAANVMRPGVIEATLCDANNWPRMSDSIRKALLGETENAHG